MSEEIERKLSKIPVINRLVELLKILKVPAFEGLSFYDLIEMYLLGIIRGAVSTRASSISFSLFMALFPLLIFLVTLVPFIIPFVSVGENDFDIQLLVFLESFLPTATGDYFSEIYQQIKDQKQGGLLSSAFLLSIFLMANGVNAIFDGFENSYHVNLTRSFFRSYAYALMVGVILSVLLIVGAVVFIYFEFYILDYFGNLATISRG
ncbi:MAG: membrane protein, partial [Sediminicola sp.]